MFHSRPGGGPGREGRIFEKYKSGKMPTHKIIGRHSVTKYRFHLDSFQMVIRKVRLLARCRVAQTVVSWLAANEDQKNL